MPIEVGIWKLGETLERVRPVSMDSERRLEDYICEDLSILSPDLMLIGRQIATDFGKFIDLLAMDADGNLVIIELKKDRTPRDVVAQILDYASWVQNLSSENILALYTLKNDGKAFEEAFAEMFDSSPPEELNESHQLIVVAAELDTATERIINYLADNHSVPINAIFFRYFKEGDSEFLTRTWLIDPNEVVKKIDRKKKDSEQWNGQDFYVNFGDGSSEGEGVYRSWEDAVRYSFVSAGGEFRFGRAMGLLFAGARIFVNIPKNGYVAVGTVTHEAVPVSEFMVEVDGKQISFLDAPHAIKLDHMREEANDPKKREMIVKVDWIKAVPKSEAYWEKGLFANPKAACRLRNRFTMERLTEHFGLGD